MLQLELDEELIVLGDEEKLKQIFINVIENAIRYSNEGSTVHIRTAPLEDTALIEVQDHGIGIPTEDLPHITERFYRVNKARSRADGGSGLGLYVVVAFLERIVFPKVEVGAFSHVMDFKSQLQEIIQQTNNGLLSYEIVDEKGPAHNRTFVSRVVLNNGELGIGRGKSKKEAEQQAAQNALLSLKQSKQEGE